MRMISCLTFQISIVKNQGKTFSINGKVDDRMDFMISKFLLVLVRALMLKTKNMPTTGLWQ